MAGGVDRSDGWLRLALDALLAAETLERQGLWRDAMSRAYYAMFYATTAALESVGVKLTRHSAVIAAFGQRFARTGLLEPKYHRWLVDAFDDRESAD